MRCSFFEKQARAGMLLTCVLVFGTSCSEQKTLASSKFCATAEDSIVLFEFKDAETVTYSARILGIQKTAECVYSEAETSIEVKCGDYSPFVLVRLSGALRDQSDIVYHQVEEEALNDCRID
ncbi:MAG: hypothetical protein AAGI88_02385 [Pseudomonadota bacterium]